MSKTVRSFLITLLAALFVIVSAIWVFISFVKSRPNGFPTDLLLKQYDLPRGFQRKEFLSVDVPNAEALAIGYVVPDGSKFPVVRVSHELAMYADEQSAQAAYSGWEKELFPVAEWKTPGDFDFKPTDSDDLYRFGCMPGYFNGTDFIGCTYVQQHKNMISELLFNLDDKILKLSDVENILASLDARLSQK